MANNNSDSKEIEVVETKKDLSKELGFDIAAAVFEPDGRTIEINFNNEKDGSSSPNDGGDATTDSGKPVNTHVKFVSDGVEVHHVKTDPSMQIPENELDEKKKAQIKAREKRSKEQKEKEAGERE